MASKTENPYRPPLATAANHQPGCLADRLKCPHCGRPAVPFWRAYLVVPLRAISCSACQTKVRIAKFGFGRWSSFVLAIPGGIVGAFLALHLMTGDVDMVVRELGFSPNEFGVHVTASWFAVTLFIISVADYLIDRRFTYIQRTTPPPRPEAGEMVAGDSRW